MNLGLTASVQQPFTQFQSQRTDHRLCFDIDTMKHPHSQWGGASKKIENLDGKILTKENPLFSKFP